MPESPSAWQQVYGALSVQGYQCLCMDFGQDPETQTRRGAGDSLQQGQEWQLGPIFSSGNNSVGKKWQCQGQLTCIPEGML